MTVGTRFGLQDDNGVYVGYISAYVQHILYTLLPTAAGVSAVA